MNVRLISIGSVVLAVHVLVIGAFWLGLRKGESNRPPAEREDFALVSEDDGAAMELPRLEPPPNGTSQTQRQQTQTTPRQQQTQTTGPAAGGSDTAVRHHVVANGESFWRIANTYGVSVKDLMAANNYSANDTLQVGVKLEIPAAGR